MGKRLTDQCRARGCDGLLTGVEAIVSDGDTAHCGKCGRQHTFHVPYDGGPVHVRVDRKPRASMRSRYAAAPGLACSFCGVSQKETKVLIAGPTVYICEACVAIAYGLIPEDVRVEVSRRVPSAGERRRAVHAISRLRALIDALEIAIRDESVPPGWDSAQAVVQTAVEVATTTARIDAYMRAELPRIAESGGEG